MVSRYLKARYRGTALGVLWSFLTPLLTISAYVLVFSVYMRSGVPHYAAFLVSGLLPWGCFVSGLTEGADALLANGHLVKKIYLPGEVFPLVSVLSNTMHFILSIPVMLGVVWWLGLPPSWPLLVLPCLLFLQVVFTYGLALLLCSLATQFRDIKHVLPNLTYIWFFLTPVVYSPADIPSRFQYYASLNPMYMLVHSYQAVFYHRTWPSLSMLTHFSYWAFATLLLGGWVFRKRSEIHAEFLG